eukprot:scaffold7635_cov131-Skeletonema_marinoi.AAC.7
MASDVTKFGRSTHEGINTFRSSLGVEKKMVSHFQRRTAISHHLKKEIKRIQTADGNDGRCAKSHHNSNHQLQ